MTTPALLDELLRTPGPSGYEGPAAKVWREAASFAEITTDGLGSSVATIGPGGDAADAPLVAVVGHIDEIGLVVTHIDEKGFLYFAPIGGWDPQILVGQRVTITGNEGQVPGVAGRKPIHLLDPEQRKKVVKLKEMHIDIGAGDREEAQELVSVGDPVVIDSEPLAVAGGRLVSRSMDNRLGSYIALEALRRCHENARLKARFAAVAAVQEEIGLFGSRTASFTVRPDLAVAIDVTHATDAPGIDEKEVGTHPFGSGPVIGRGSTLSPRLYELLRDAAEEAGISYSVGASGNATHTDADSLQISRTGIPTGLVSIPLRYMHSPVEMVDLADVEATVELVVAFVESIEAGVDLSR
jgi:putative aminopeptidase FrvX